MLSAIRLRRGTVAALLALALFRAYAQAAQPGASGSGATDLGSVQTSAPGDSSGNTAGRAPDTALAVAPGHVPIDAEQPSDVVSHRFLQNDVIPTENFNDVVRLTPSAMDIDPVGPGLQQNFGQSIRGFQYTQFDNDFDGIEIPNSPSNYSPQTAAYFMQHDIGTITVDRGPGTASTIGLATFGGTVSITSRTPSSTVQLNPYATSGSFGTRLFGLDLESGAVASLNGGRGYIDLSREEARGALTGVSTERRNGFVRWDQPIGERTLVTFVEVANNSDTHTPYGTPMVSMQKYGRDYALNNDPTSGAFAGYNRDNYTTDLGYVRVQHDFGGGLQLDERAYTSGFYHRGTLATDPTGLSPNLSGSVLIGGQRVNVTGDVPGYAVHNDYRAFGTVTRLTQDTLWGQARAGIWVERDGNSVDRARIDLSRDGVVYQASAAASPYQYQYYDSFLAVQPYVEVAWTPLPGLTVTPGVKYSSFTRTLDASVNRTTGLPARYNATYNKALPEIAANYVISPGFSAYAQVARGFLAPALNVFYVTQLSSVLPETTTNYQVGTVLNRGWLNANADLYYITLDNFLQSTSVGQVTLFSNNGGAVYKGAEIEATAKLGRGVSLYANGSLNSSAYTGNGNTLAQTPRRTGAAGVIYDHAKLLRPRDEGYALLVAKNVGPQYGLDTNAVGKQDQFPIKSYNTVDLTLGYVFPLSATRRARFGVQVANLLNDRSLIAYNGLSSGAAALPLYFVNASRSVFFSVSAAL